MTQADPGPAQRRLATYGTLSPGQPNHHQLDGLVGTWRKGVVRGRRFMVGWGAAMGFPGMIADSAGDAIEVMVFDSADLPAHWPRLDAFEGEGYRRTAIDVEIEGGVVAACIYLLADAG